MSTLDYARPGRRSLIAVAIAGAAAASQAMRDWHRRRQAVRQLQDMHGWWRAGDVAKLDSEMRAEMARKTPESYRLLDVGRNDAWLPKIEARLKDSRADDTLVVVGTLHLLGEDGLVEKLRAKGYSVERMCEGCEAPAAK